MNHHRTHQDCPQCRAEQCGTWRSKTARRAMPLLAAGIVGAVLPLAGHGDAGASPVVAAAKKPFAGYSSDGQAQPIRVEVFEPTIPIPATPQAEIELSYTTTEADSSTSHGRASYVWPGDAVGEGFKTIAEALGLPLPAEVTADGYPIQVNSAFPAGPESEVSQPTPGQVMRTTAKKQDTIAESAFSSDCKTTTDDPGGDDDGGGILPGLPGLPLPGLPGLPVSGSTAPSLPGLLAPSLKLGAAAPAAKADDGTECMTPTQLDAIISTGEGQSVTKTHAVAGKQVFTQARASASDIKIAGGLVTLSGVSSRSRSFSDGKAAKPTGKAHYGILAIAGQKFTIGPDGVESAAGNSAIPGLPDAPAAALEELGISFEVPKPVFTKLNKDGATDASTEVEALIVTIDSGKLRSRLDAIPFDDITGIIPDDAGDLKSALQAATHLSSKFVIHLGVTETQTKTVPPLVLPSVVVSSPTVSESPTESASPSESATTTPAPNPSGGNPGGGSNPLPDTSGDLPPVDTGDIDLPPGSTITPSTPIESASPSLIDSKLPGLFTIPGLLLYGGLAGGALAGAYVRRLGLAALGGTSSCPHGLDSGLPDLRKA